MLISIFLLILKYEFIEFLELTNSSFKNWARSAKNKNNHNVTLRDEA